MRIVLKCTLRGERERFTVGAHVQGARAGTVPGGRNDSMKVNQQAIADFLGLDRTTVCLLYTSPSPRDRS